MDGTELEYGNNNRADSSLANQTALNLSGTIQMSGGSHCCVPGSERIIVPIVFSIVVILGCIGNCLVIVVVLKNRDHFRNTTNLFILNLAVADILFLVFCVPFHAIIYTTMGWPFGEFMCKFVHLIQYSSMIASIFTLMAMALDRFLAVAYPLKTKHIRRPGIALATTVVLWGVSLAMAVPWPVFYTVRVYKHVGMAPMSICADDWGKLRSSRPTYYLLLFLFAYALPLISIFILSGLMVYQLWRTKGPEGPRMEDSIKAKRKVTRLVITVVIVFLISWLPAHIVWLWTNYFPHTVKMTYTFFYLKIVSHVLSYGNSAMNPVIYAFLSENFRKGFNRALQCSGNRIIPALQAGSKLVYSVNSGTQREFEPLSAEDTCL